MEIIQKNILTQHAKTNQYAYLVDEQAGYSPHLRIGHQVKGELVASAAELTYRKSGRLIVEKCGDVSISGQAVKLAVDTFEHQFYKKENKNR